MLMFDNGKQVDLVAESTRLLLQGLAGRYGLDIHDENFTDTPDRVSRMYDEVLSGVGNTDEQIDDILKSAFDCESDQMILVRNVEAFSLCPHHLLPVHYKIHVAYIPKGRVLGISKLARIADVLARRPVLQEQLVNDIADSLCRLDIRGAGCIAEGQHYCMSMRGVRQPGARTITSCMRGSFLEPGVKEEFLRLVSGV